MGLLGWWQLENDRDNSGNGKHITTLSGVTLTDGKIGKCYEFTSGSRMIASGITVGHSCTITAWGYSTSWASSAMLFSLNSASFSGPDLYFTGGVICWNTGDGNSNPFKNNGANVTQPSLNTWHHYAVVVDAEKNKVYLYLNGEYYGEANYKSPYQSNRNFVIGNYSANTSYAWRGRIDDVRLYDYCLSPKEIKELAKAKILHYKFDDFQEPTKNLIDVTSYSLYSNNSNVYPIQKESYEGHFRIRRNSDFSTYPSATFSCYTNVFYDSVAGKQYAHSVYVKPEKDVRLSLATSNYVLCPAGVWTRLERVFTASNTGSVRFSGLYSSDSFGPDFNPWIEVRDPQCEEKGHVTPFVPSERPGMVYDCSGYDNHAELALATTPRWVGSESSKIGSGAYDFAGVGKAISFIKPIPKLQEFTLSAWVYNVQGDSRQSIIRNFWEVVGTSIAFWSYDFADEYWRQSPSGVVPYGQWTHIATTWDGSVIRHYANGELVHTSATSSGTSQEFLGIAGYSGRNFSGKLDDVRIYATALSDDDIKELYQTRAALDSHGNLYVQDIKEPENIGLSANDAIKNKIFAGGLGRYTQAHCQVTLTDRGLRIYRTPNLTQATDGNVMYGGMRISLLSLLPGGIQEGRRYRVTFDVEGQTYQSNSPISITNNMGWGGGGLTPNPLVIKNDSTLGANFQGHKKCEYIFEVRDSIYKVCTTSYSSFVAGNIYPSYNHLTFHFGYGTTGAIGTDIYITNFKIMDITDTQLNSISDKGVATYDDFSELGPMNGIIAWWPLDGHTDDYSGNNNHATNNGATITSGIRGRAYEFDGSSYIRASNPLVQSAPFSISFWTKISSTSTQCLGCTRTEVGNGMSIFVINNKLRFDTDHQWTTGYTVPQNEWIHVVLMQDTSGKKLYIDGELEDSTSSVGSMSNLSSIFQIGASHSNGSSLGNYLNGVVSDYRIYNRALSPEEVKILYNATKPDPVPMQISNNGIVYLAGELKEV